MKKLIIHGNPGVRKNGIIEYDGGEWVVFAVNVQGEWHGPDRPQLWCTIGKEDERERFQYQDYIAMHLETDHVDAEDVEVIRKAGTA